MPIIEFLDDQHESYMLQEQQPAVLIRLIYVFTLLVLHQTHGHTLSR